MQPWSIDTAPEGGTVWAINFDWLHKHGKRLPEAAMLRLRDRLAPLPGVASRVADAHDNEWGHRPSIPADALFADPTAAEAIIQALDEAITDEGGA